MCKRDTYDQGRLPSNESADSVEDTVEVVADRILAEAADAPRDGADGAAAGLADLLFRLFLPITMRESTRIVEGRDQPRQRDSR